MNGPLVKTVALLLCALMTAVPGSAQDTPDTSAPALSRVTWRLAAGKGSLWMRDVARSRLGQGVDASPVSWEARGVAFTAERDRSSARRLHRFQVSFEQAGDAVFRTPLATSARPAGDGGVRLALSTEHGRYPFVDLGVSGLDVGFGLQASAEFTSVTQHHDPAIEARESETNLTTGVAVTARFRRWWLLQIEASWVNGGALVRTTTRHSAAVEETARAWGVGWLTDLTMRVDARVSTSVTILASYFESGRGRFVSHGASASGRRRWMVGVSYGR